MDVKRYKWQVLAFVGLIVSLFFSLRYIGAYVSNPVAVELIAVSMVTLILLIGLGIAIVSVASPRIMEYKTRPRAK